MTNLDYTRVFIGCDALFYKVPDVIFLDLCAVIQDDDGHDFFAQVGMGQPDDGCFHNFWNLVDNFLNFPRIDIVASADDEIFFSVDNVNVTVLIHAGDIAGVEPTALQGLFRISAECPYS